MVAAVPLGVRCLRLSLISLAAVLLLIWGKEGQRNIELLVFGATSWTLRLNWLRRMSARGGGCDVISLLPMRCDGISIGC